MTVDKLTLAHALPLEIKAELAQVRSRLAKDKQKLGLQLAVPWEQLEEPLAEKVLALLDVPILDLCFAAWKKSREIQQFADPKKYPPGEANEVALLEHDIVSEHHPSLEISADGVRVQTLEFDLDVSLKLQGGVLGIESGRIMSVMLGKCQGEATLECKGVVLLEVETKELDFGKPVKLGEGIPIAGGRGKIASL